MNALQFLERLMTEGPVVLIAVLALVVVYEALRLLGKKGGDK